MNGPVVVEVEYIPSGYSKCTKCGEVLPLNDDFFRFVRGRKSYRPECKECESLYRKSYCATKPYAITKASQKRRALKAATVSDYEKDEWEEALNTFNHACAYCGSKKNLQQDHFIPLTKGGGYTRSNIIPACGHCNSSKGNRDYYTWYPNQPSYTLERHNRIVGYIERMRALEGIRKYRTRGEEIASFLFFDL